VSTTTISPSKQTQQSQAQQQGQSPAAAPAPYTTAETQAAVAQAIGKVSSIATLPEVTSQIIKTVEDPRSSAAQLHKIIAHDPALVTRILKVVNSSFYGLPGQIGSIERAIVLLGLNAVKNIAVAASLGQLFRGVTLCNGFTAKDLWTHCISVASVARHLAREMRVPVADEAFLAGMIHDIGILVELQVWPDKLRQACENRRRPARTSARSNVKSSGWITSSWGRDWRSNGSSRGPVSSLLGITTSRHSLRTTTACWSRSSSWPTRSAARRTTDSISPHSIRRSRTAT